MQVMYEINKIQFAFEAFKEKLDQNRAKWSTLWETLEQNPSIEEVYDITNKATFLAKSEKEEIDRLESHLVHLKCYNDELQTKRSEILKDRDELLERYEALCNDKMSEHPEELKIDFIDSEDGFTNELVPIEDSGTVRKSIAFEIDLNATSIQIKDVEVDKKRLKPQILTKDSKDNIMQHSPEKKSFLASANEDMDGDRDAHLLSNDLIDKSGDSLLGQNGAFGPENDSMLSNTFLNEMEELKSNLELDSSQNSMDGLQNSVCYNSSKEPVRVDPETPKATDFTPKESEKPSGEVKKKGSSLISKFIKKSRSLSRSRKDKKKKTT